MSIRVGSTVINCADIEVMTDFWSVALDLHPSSRDTGDDFRVLRGERVNLSLQVARTPISARDQMHLDLYTNDLDYQIDRFLDLVAVFVRRGNDPDDIHAVMRDPEGNEFCICLVNESD